MNEHTLKDKLHGQTRIAQRVFEFVPMQESWTAQRIRGAMGSVEASAISLHVLRGCLATLRDSGLVRESSAGEYRRIEVTTPKAKEHRPQGNDPMPTARPPVAVPASAADSHLNTITAISNRIRTWAEAGKAIAEDLDNAALEISVGNQQNADAAVKLAQLQALLKG